MRIQCPRGGCHDGTVLATVVLLVACVGCADPLPAQSELLDKNRQAFPVAPAAGTGALAPSVRDALARVVPSLQQQRFPTEAVRTIGMSGDGRLLWYLYDLLRFATRDSLPIVVDAFEELSGTELPSEPVTAMGDRVLAWDLPAPPDYRLLKRDLFLLIEPRWAPFFEDEDSVIDWTRVGWGGVFIDDRPDATAGQICPRGCISALDEPAVTGAEGGSWYPDDDLVFGIVIGRQARAYPKNIMEVHEMVNDTLGGASSCHPVLHALPVRSGVLHRRRRELPAAAADLRAVVAIQQVHVRRDHVFRRRHLYRRSHLRTAARRRHQAQPNHGRDLHVGGVARGPPTHLDRRGGWRNRPELPAQSPAGPRRRRADLSSR